MRQTSDLLRLAKEGTPSERKSAREQLVLENTGLIWSVVKRFQGRGYDREDLFQIGAIGLIKCIDNFDLQRNVMFSTYAVPLIMGEIRRFLRDDGMVKVSRSLRELFYKIKREEENFLKQKDRLPTIEELAEKLMVSQEDIAMALEAGQDAISLHQVIYQSEGDEIHLEDKLEKQTDEIEDAINQIYLKEMLDQLEDSDKKLIKMRYFQNKTQSAVARVMGISQVQVSRMEKRILGKMRKLI